MRRHSSLSLIVSAFIIGIALWPITQIAAPFTWALYDKVYPIVTMDGDIVGRGADHADIHIYGKKNRQCKYIQTRSYIRIGEQLKDVTGNRIDTPETGGTKPLGTFDIGVWRVTPIAGGSDVVMYVQHDCSGRLVLTKIADEHL